MMDGAGGDTLTVGVLQGMLRLTVPLVMMTVRLLQVMVLGVGPRMGDCRWFLARSLATPGGGLAGIAGRLARRSWRCPSPLVSGQLLANIGGGCRWCC